MKNKTYGQWGGLVFAGLLVFSAAAHAEAIVGVGDERLLTPRERIRINAVKGIENPSLHGRWNPKEWQPASSAAFLSDDLPQRVLGQFRTDPELSEVAARIKVHSSGGNVVLEGVVNSAADKELIERKVSAMDGVKKLDSQLRIKKSDKEIWG